MLLSAAHCDPAGVLATCGPPEAITKALLATGYFEEDGAAEAAMVT